MESVARKLEAGRVAATIEGLGFSSSEATASLSPSPLQIFLLSIAALIDIAALPLLSMHARRSWKGLRQMCTHNLKQENHGSGHR